jgi:hypothetical protein
MATRQTAAQKAAAEAEAAQAATKAADTIPDAWGTEPIDEFNGHNLTDKADLIGVPFLIIGAEIERTDGKDYDVAYVYALDTNGTEFEFSDTSTTGVRAQIQAMLAEKGLPPHAGAGFQKLRTVIRQGLRSSEFSVTDEETGKKRKATSYYLSAAGRKTVSESV